MQPTSARSDGAITGLAVRSAVVCGGIAALSWEVMWQLRASLALGVSALGTAITLAATMAGMTTGSLLMGRWLRRRTPSRPLHLYGNLELVIGLSGLLLLPGFELLERLDAGVYALRPSAAPLVHGFGIALLLGVPTFAMGATIPTFQLVARSHGAPISVLYGLNTAGAAFGVLCFSFVLLPAFGVRQTVQMVAALNLVVFAATRWIPPLPSAAAAVGPARDSAPDPPRISPRLAESIVFGTGFATFALEVAWFRSLRAAFQNTSDSFAIILASVLIPLAVGARLVPWMRRREHSPGAALACAGVAILLATPLVERMDLMASPLAGQWETLAMRLGLSLAILGPGILLLGMVLPWCLEEFPAPVRTGRLYAINTIGAVVGSVSAAWLLLPGVGFARSAWLVGAAVVLLGLPLAAGRARWTRVAAGAVGLAVAVTQTSSLGRDRVQIPGGMPGHSILAHEEGPDSTISVIESPRGPRLLMIDGFAATGEAFGAHYMTWMGILPVLLHPNPERTLVICFGTGQTADGLRDEGAGAIDVVDLNRAVFDMAPLFPSNERILESPVVRPVVMDGRAWLRRDRSRYDVVTMEPMHPNFAGTNALYSRNFYEIMSERLAPGAVVAQWLPFHLLRPRQAAAVAATFVDAFPDSVLWLDPVSGTGVLLGREEAGAAPLGASWPGLDRRSGRRTLEDDEIRQGVTLDQAALARYARSGSLITDDNQLLAYGFERGAARRVPKGSLQKANHRIIAQFAGHPIFRIRTHRAGAPRLRGPQRDPENGD